MKLFRTTAPALFVSFLIMFSACNEGNEGEKLTEPVEILKVNVSPDFLAYDEQWVILTNNLGEVIDHQPIAPGETIIFNSAVEIPNGKFTVTVLKFLEADPTAPSPATCRATSYLDIEEGREINLEVSPVYSTYDGVTASLQLLNYPNDKLYKEYTVSSFDGNVNSGGSGTQSGSLWNWDLDLDMPKNPADIFVCLTSNAYPKYLSLSSVALNSSLIADYNNMLVLDNVFSITFPTVTRYDIGISGYASTSQAAPTSTYHMFSKAIRSNESIDLKVGYNNNYPLYQTYWSQQQNKKIATYRKIGAPPVLADFSVPNFDITILNSAFNNFSYQKNFSSDFMSAQWKTGNSLWFVVGPLGQNQPIMNQIPEEIATAHPEVSTFLSGLVLGSTAFHQSKNAFTYSDYIELYLGPIVTNLKPKEYITFGLNQ